MNCINLKLGWEVQDRVAAGVEDRVQDAHWSVAHPGTSIIELPVKPRVGRP